jgi:glucose/arabinose dehydrogenase
MVKLSQVGLAILVFLVILLGNPGHATELLPGFEETPYVTGLSLPTAMDFAPDGRLFICEKSGSLRVVQNGVLLSIPFLTVPVATESERGLLGVAFDPRFAVNRYVYVYYTRASAPIKNRISRFTASVTDPNVADPASEVVILDDIASDAGNHNGGVIHFGSDQKLYVGVGDGGANAFNSQSLATLSGKLLRIDPSTYPTIVPTDNPFVDVSSARGEIWALGLRNPFTFAIQPGSDTLFINDVGQNTWEEVNRGIKGGNYGWPEAEGNSTNPNFQNPVYAYNHNGSNASITGGTFYQSNQFPSEYLGNYFFADYVLGFIRRLVPPDYNQATDFAQNVASPVDLKVGTDGYLYYLSFFRGSVYRLRYVGDANRSPIALLDANPSAGNVPLQVQLSGQRSRDPDGDPLTYLWDLGDGSPVQTSATINHTYTTLGQYLVTLTVSDGRGGTSIATAIITTGNNLPVGQITAPIRQRYSAGTTVYFAGTATDPEDGELPASAFSWTLIFHHADHTHPFLGPIAGVTSGTFQIPKTGETSPDVFYRVQLTVTDRSGLTHTSFQDIKPRTSVLSFQTTPPGLSITLDGQPTPTPASVNSVVGVTRTLGAPAVQTVNGVAYEFVQWSDGGAATHTIDTPLISTTYTATYQIKN